LGRSECEYVDSPCTKDTIKMEHGFRSLYCQDQIQRHLSCVFITVDIS